LQLSRRRSLGRLLYFFAISQNSSAFLPINRLALQANIMVVCIQTITVIIPSLPFLTKVSAGFLFMGWSLLALRIDISLLQGHPQS
jgi:hypothetical protein